MKIKLNKAVVGYKHESLGKVASLAMSSPRIHAEAGATVPVILRNSTHFICDSINYPDQYMIVFNDQCNVIENSQGRNIIEDPNELEKFFHVYEEFYSQTPDDPFHSAFEFEDSTQ